MGPFADVAIKCFMWGFSKARSSAVKRAECGNSFETAGEKERATNYNRLNCVTEDFDGKIK